MSETSSSRSSRHCPHCRSRVKRVERGANDKRLTDADRWRRYRCRNPGCGWEGLLQVSRRRRIPLQPEVRVSRGLRLAGVTLAVAVMVVLGWGAFQVVQGLFDN